MATPKKKTPEKPEKKAEAPKASSKAKVAPTKSAPAKTPPPPPVEKPKIQIDPDLVEEIKHELLRKKQELGSNVSNELDDMREAAEGHHLADMDDLGGDAHDEETQYKILEIESAELGQIDMALDRIVAGTFGACEVCEKPISADRLRALPFTNLCINCKRLQEQNEA
jgi:DnaK suppressor protein